MDMSPDIAGFEQPFSTLSYDDSVPYEDQLPTNSETTGLASRIGNTKVYLLSESSVPRVGKRKRDDEEGEGEGEEPVVEGPGAEDVEMDGDPSLRGNALLLTGTPISHLPTARLFAYATHFDTHPLGMEWVDDNTCVFVFDTKLAAQTGYRYLRKAASEEPDTEGFITAKPIPIAFWPPEERINKSLGKGEGLKGIIRLRWARVDDVKKKGAKKDSEFYRKHGRLAGKELFNGRELQGSTKRRRKDDEEDLALQRERLDKELNEFLAEDDPDVELPEPSSPPSKMRSDYIAADGRTLLERTSLTGILSDKTPDLASRLTAPLPRRARQRNPISLEDRLWSDKKVNDRRNGGRTSSRPSRDRPKKSQQELDDELDAFLNEQD